MDFYSIIAPCIVTVCSFVLRQCDILGPAIVGAGAHSQLRQIDRVDEEVWDPVHCLPKIEKVKTTRIAKSTWVRALPQRHETDLVELAPRLRSNEAADECLRFLAHNTRGGGKIKPRLTKQD